jgi:hypothetical protein
VAAGDSYTLSFSAGNVYVGSPSSLFDGAAIPETLVAISVLIDGVLVFGPIIPPPMPDQQAGSYSFQYNLTLDTRLDRVTSPGPKTCSILTDLVLADTGLALTIIAEPSDPNSRWSALVSAIELIPAASNAERNAMQLSGLSPSHHALAGKYLSTDLLHSGFLVFVHFQSSNFGSAVPASNSSSYIFFDEWSGTIMVTSRTAREQRQPPELFVPLGSSSLQAELLSSMSAPWLEQVGDHVHVGQRDPSTELPRTLKL